MKRFKVKTTSPDGSTYTFYWDLKQTKSFTSMSDFELEHIVNAQVKFDDGSGYTIEEDK